MPNTPAEEASIASLNDLTGTPQKVLAETPEACLRRLRSVTKETIAQIRLVRGPLQSQPAQLSGEN